MNGYLSWVILGLLVAGYLAWRKQKKNKPAHKSGWWVGPTVNGKNFSSNVALQPTRLGKWWFLDLPVGKGSANYIECYDDIGLKNAKQIRLRYKIEGGTRFIAQDANASPIASLGLYIQRRGDDWGDPGTGDSRRWFSKAQVVLAEGEFELVVPMDEASWGGTNATPNPTGFQAAKNDMVAWGIVLGSAGGLGHGVFTETQARLTLLSVEVVVV